MCRSFILILSIIPGIRTCSSSLTFRRLLKTHPFNQAFPLAAHTSASDSAFWPTLCTLKEFIYFLTYLMKPNKVYQV